MKFLKYPFGKTIKLNQRFGVPDKLYTSIGLKGHNGIDFSCPIGTPILAMHDGVVLTTVVDNKGGLGVEIRSNEKIKINENTHYYKTLYWHLSSFSCSVGQLVKAGDIIGYSGNTGYSTGPHLHNALKLIDDNFNTLNKDNGYAGAIDHLEFIDFGVKYQFTKTLKKGSKGDDVLALQEILSKLGYFDINDKYNTFGNKTILASRIFQILLIGESNMQKSYLNNEWAKNEAIIGKLTINLLNKICQ